MLAIMAETEMLWWLADAAIEAGDFIRAKAVYEQGAALGDPGCWHGLGFMFDTGQGVKVDKEHAMKCYKAAWRSKNVSSANNIAILYKERGERRAMFSWFKRAAEHGDDGAYLDLAKCYLDGVGTRRSISEAVRCLARVMAGRCASEDDREQAQEMLRGFRLQMI